jgi:D-amino-acid dehydrogenase
MSRTVVIGAGVIGLSIGYELTRRGQEVIVVDRGEPGNACSLGNAGWIVPSFSAPLPKPGLTLTSLKWLLQRDSPLAIEPRALPHLAGWLWKFWRHCNKHDYLAGLEALMALNHSTMDLYDSLEKDDVQFEMQRAGLLFVFLGEAAQSETLEDFEMMKQYGYKVPRPLSKDDLLGLEPALSDDVAAGFLVEEERHVRPESLSAGLAKRLLERGGEILTGRDITAANSDGARVRSILTSRGDITGDHFVIAAGAWSGAIAKRFGLTVPVEAGKGYSITIENPRRQLRRPLYLGEAKVGCSPFEGALRLAGTMELSDVNPTMRPERIQAICKSLGQYLRVESDGRSRTEWMGMRPLTPDGLPVIGRAPGYTNLLIATGHAMLGVTLAPATAAAIADLICEGKCAVNLAPFDPARFG